MFLFENFFLVIPLTVIITKKGFFQVKVNFKPGPNQVFTNLELEEFKIMVFFLFFSCSSSSSPCTPPGLQTYLLNVSFRNEFLIIRGSIKL